jgi:SPP1 gp7 family putative phage head morphogenesis protein
MVTGWEAAVREALATIDKAASTPAQTTALKAIAKHLKTNVKDIEGIVTKLYEDAGLAGTQHAVDDLGAQGVPVALNSGMAGLASSINWDQWTPGNPAAAKKVAGDQLWNVLNKTGITLLDIGKYTHKRIGNILAAGLESGATYTEIATGITALLKDRTRAEIVAMTEAGRAFNAAMIDQYQDAGLAQFRWLAYSGACPECQSQDGPHPITAAHPPAHPNCRCAMIAITPSNLGSLKPRNKPVIPETPVADLATEASQLETATTNVISDLTPAPAKLEHELHPAAPEPVEPTPVAQEATIVEAPPEHPLDRFYDITPSQVPKNLQLEPYAGDYNVDFKTQNLPYVNNALRQYGSFEEATTATTEEIDQLIDEGWLPVYRGVAGGPGDAPKFHENFRSADPEKVYVGRGIYGHGQYSSTSFERALDYADINPRRWMRQLQNLTNGVELDTSRFDDGVSSVQRMLINPKAKWLDVNEFSGTIKLPPHARALADKLAGEGAVGSSDTDTILAIYARSAGYDGIRVTKTALGGADENYYNILNRTAVIFEEQPMTVDQLILRSEGGDTAELAKIDKQMYLRSKAYTQKNKGPKKPDRGAKS